MHQFIKFFLHICFYFGSRAIEYDITAFWEFFAWFLFMSLYLESSFFGGGGGSSFLKNTQGSCWYEDAIALKIY